MPASRFHEFLNETLRQQAAEPNKAHALAAAGVKRLAKELSRDEIAALALTAFDRAAWIDAHAQELAARDEWRRRLETVLYHLYEQRPPFVISEMCRLVAGAHGTPPPVGRVAEYFAGRDLTPEACAAIRRRRAVYQAHIDRGDYRPVDVQSELQVLDMLLWHDETAELELAACWSERVRRDYRAMSGERRRRWQSLLRHIRGDAGSKPPKPWVKEAQQRLASVGAKDFGTTVADWFAAFREPQPLKLSAVGSHVLKGLLWYCALARDPAVTEAALPILDAPWKPKRNLDKVMVALALLIDTTPLEQAWAALLPLQSAWGASQGRIEQLVIKIAADSDISEQQLRAQGVLKPRLPDPPTASADELAAGWLAVERFLATLRALYPQKA